MTPSTQNKVTVKIFLGLQLPVNLKLELQNNPKWKEDAIAQKEIILLQHDGETFMGHYLKDSLTTMKQVQENTQTLRGTLRGYLAETRVEKLKVSLFPQVFVL